MPREYNFRVDDWAGESKTCWGLESCRVATALWERGTLRAKCRRGLTPVSLSLLSRTALFSTSSSFASGLRSESTVARAPQKIRTHEVRGHRSRHLSIECQERVRSVFTKMNAEHEFNIETIRARHCTSSF